MVSEVPLVYVRYSHCSNSSGIPVSSVSFSRSENVSSNKVSIVVVFVRNTISRYQCLDAELELCEGRLKFCVLNIYSCKTRNWSVSCQLKFLTC